LAHTSAPAHPHTSTSRNLLSYQVSHYKRRGWYILVLFSHLLHRHAYLMLNTDIIVFNASNNTEHCQLQFNRATFMSTLASLTFTTKDTPSSSSSPANDAPRLRSSSGVKMTALPGRSVRASYTIASGACGQIAIGTAVDMRELHRLLMTKYLNNRQCIRSLGNVTR
jgi:hypothetical protein